MTFLKDYRLDPRFSDEFDAATLDLAKWDDSSPQWIGRAPGYFDRRNIRLRNGCLELTAAMQQPDEIPPLYRTRGMGAYTTAYVTARERVLYGYFEARFQAMRANVCNAFWLHDPLDPPAKYREGDFSEEIDIFEVFGRRDSPEGMAEPNLDRTYFTTLHRLRTPYVEACVGLHNQPVRHQQVMPFDFTEDFHVGALLWTPDELVWFLDGMELFRVPNLHYHRPLRLNIDCEIMQGWTGLPRPEDLPARYRIDYVRVYRLPQ